MITKKTIYSCLLSMGVVFLFASGLSACGTEPGAIPAVEQTQPGQPEPTSPGEPASEPVVPTAIPEVSVPDPAAIEAAWQSGPHAQTFIQDAAGQNNSCARCHAPVSWQPAMDDLPESCYACKFELEDPPPFISENDWTHVPCKVCHKVNKEKTVQAEIAWLEIAPLDEYSAVSTPSELCLKCHAPAGTAGHGEIQLSGAHSGYECTECHPAHDVQASCGTGNCHQDVTAAATSIPGHDEDHQGVSCAACHDGSGMEVGPDEAAGGWTTFTTGPAGSSGEPFAFTSHHIVLEASCERCHFTDNPWALPVGVEAP